MIEIRLTELPEDAACVAALRVELEAGITLDTPETRPMIEALRTHLRASEIAETPPEAQ